MKANSKIVILFVLIFTMLLNTTVFSAEHVVNVPTPEAANLKWAAKIGEGWQKSAGVPLVTDDEIVISSGNELYLVDKNDGTILKRTTMAESHSYGYIPPILADGKIFMPLSKGTIQAFDATTLEALWTYTDLLGGQGLSQVTYSSNTVFTGFWNGETKNASFVALDSSTGEMLWSKTIDGGLYWAGAYCSEDAVIFGTDDGSDGIAHIYSCNKATGDVISEITLTAKGDIRSAVTYSNGRIYVTTKGGYLVSAKLSDGVLSDVLYGEIGSSSTSTPVIYGNRIYIGSSDKAISVFDASTLEKILSIPMPAYPQCTPLLSTYYSESENLVYIYTTYNKTPGGIVLIKIRSDAINEDDYSVTDFFDASGYEQYCICDVICDEYGTLYYKNDSGYLFALGTPSAGVSVSIAEDGFLLPKSEITVFSNTAESYGFTDQVDENAISTLDVLVASHAELLGEDFTPENASKFLVVSPEGYLSRILGIDTYNFGFAVNGKAPHDDILTNYGYTGYSLNQAIVENNDRVEFFIYRDSWAMDNYVHFEIFGEKQENVSIPYKNSVELQLKGYQFGWYSCYEESQIENMMFSVANADILLLDPKTDSTEKVAKTDANGNASISFDLPGKYVLTVIEGEGDTPIIAPWFEINITCITSFIDGNSINLISNRENTTTTTAYIAEYNNDTLVKVKRITLPNRYFSYSCELTEQSAKVFVWDSTLKPLMEVN